MKTMSDLFNIEPSLSPEQEWGKEYKVHFHCDLDSEYPWAAWQGHSKDPLGGVSTCETYKTKAEAEQALCRFLGIPTFDEWRMKR